MAKHEARLALLEPGPKAEADEPLKNWIIKALIRIIGWARSSWGRWWVLANC